MLKVRIIPTLLLKGFGLVKGKNFNSSRRIGSLLPAIKVYNQRDVDELIVLDIAAHITDEELDYESVEDFSPDCFVPLTIGGGIRYVEQVQKLLRSGADKISINSFAYENPDLITSIANKHGSQSIVSSVDVRAIEQGKWHCYGAAGTKSTSRDVLEWARELEDRGAGELLLTSIDRDGTMNGYDLELIEKVVSAVGIPVIASGGAGTYQHMFEAVSKSGASAVAASSMFQFTEQTPAEAKSFLFNKGVSVRSNYNSLLSKDLE